MTNRWYVTYIYSALHSRGFFGSIVLESESDSFPLQKATEVIELHLQKQDRVLPIVTINSWKTVYPSQLEGIKCLKIEQEELNISDNIFCVTITPLEDNSKNLREENERLKGLLQSANDWNDHYKQCISEGERKVVEDNFKMKEMLRALQSFFGCFKDVQYREFDGELYPLDMSSIDKLLEDVE